MTTNSNRNDNIKNGNNNNNRKKYCIIYVLFGTGVGSIKGLGKGSMHAVEHPMMYIHVSISQKGSVFLLCFQNATCSLCW
jgi:hypothetical protein